MAYQRKQAAFSSLNARKGDHASRSAVRAEGPFFEFSTNLMWGQHRLGTLRGRITDQLGGLVVGARVILTAVDGFERTTETNQRGIYIFEELAPGKYSLHASAPGFAVFERHAISISSAGLEQFDIQLHVATVVEKVAVPTETRISTKPNNNLSGLVLRGRALDALPADGAALLEALRAIAGPSAGPNGVQVFVDGFSADRLPPKSAIREIRINEDPFSAEYDQLGLGRIEVMTKPGTEEFHGETYLNYNNQRLNSRDPFAPSRAPFQSRLYGGSLSGPILDKRASFFLDIERNRIDDNALINATIVDPFLKIAPLHQSVLTPRKSMTFSPRFDFQLNPNNTLAARYTYTRSNQKNAGIGDFALLSSAYDSSESEESIQITETAVLSKKVVNETRFQFVKNRERQQGDNSLPAIVVSEAFTGGGSQIGQSFKNENKWEFQNYTTLTLGDHNIKAGIRLRGVRIVDSSAHNFGGTFTFAGGLAPQLDATNQVVRDASGQPLIVPIASIERYRRTLLFGRQNLSPSEIRALGGGPTEFSIARGNLLARVSQYDLGAFVQDDWSLRPNFTLSMGLRYERQNNIRSNLDFAPRIAFAWSLDGGQQDPKTVVRGGFGLFYTRFSEYLTLQAKRFNGINQQEFIITDPALLSLFPRVPPIGTLNALAIPQSLYRVSATLHSPYTIQTSISIERQLPFNFTLSATFVNSRTEHLLRSRDINAPLPGTFIPDMPGSGVRPFRNTGEIFEYESAGIFNQKQLIINVENHLGKRLYLYAVYTLNKALSDTDGVDSFPADSYDLRSEYGRSALDVRHNFDVGGWISLPWGIELNPLIYLRSGSPFNITTGRDTKGTSLFMERPAFARDLTKSSVVTTRFGTFDLNPAPEQMLIPRNFGTGPGFFAVNLRASKTIAFGTEPARGDNDTTPAQPQSVRAGGRTGFAGWLNKRRFELTLGVQIENVFNRANLDEPVGDLSSPLFGLSYSTAGTSHSGSDHAGNRRVELQVSFRF